MENYISSINSVVSISIILIQVFCLVILGSLFFGNKKDNIILKFVYNYTFIFGFLISLGAVVVSLFYSNVIGYPACELCWIQRIFIYPQVVLFGMELWKREKAIVDYSFALALIGSLVSLFHIYVEHGGASTLACATGGEGGVSCAVRYVYEFSYVSIPVMALTMGVFMMIILWNYKYMSKK
jgi:disulfide bond formation protein DsbB